MAQPAEDELEEMATDLKLLWQEYQTAFAFERSPDREHLMRRINREIEAVSMALIAAHDQQRDAIIDSNRPGQDDKAQEDK